MFVTGSLGCQEKEIERLGEGRARRRGEAGGAAEGLAAFLLQGRTPKSGAPQKWTLSATGKGGDLASPPHGF